LYNKQNDNEQTNNNNNNNKQASKQANEQTYTCHVPGNRSRVGRQQRVDAVHISVVSVMDLFGFHGLASPVLSSPIQVRQMLSPFHLRCFSRSPNGGTYIPRTADVYTVAVRFSMVSTYCGQVTSLSRCLPPEPEEWRVKVMRADGQHVGGYRSKHVGRWRTGLAIG